MPNLLKILEKEGKEAHTLKYNKREEIIIIQIGPSANKGENRSRKASDISNKHAHGSNQESHHKTPHGSAHLVDEVEKDFYGR